MNTVLQSKQKSCDFYDVYPLEEELEIVDAYLPSKRLSQVVHRHAAQHWLSHYKLENAHEPFETPSAATAFARAARKDAGHQGLSQSAWLQFERTLPRAVQFAEELRQAFLGLGAEWSSIEPAVLENGAIDIEFKHAKADFLFHVADDRRVAYSAIPSNEQPGAKGPRGVLVPGQQPEFLAIWTATL